MYGTVATLKVKPGSQDALAELNERWWAERGSKVQGAVSSIIYKTDKDPNEYVLVAVFESKEAYTKNADDPEQDKWFREMASHFAAEPVWNDGEVVFYKA